MAQQKYDLPPEFLDAADRFVSLANELGDEHARDWVRAVFMYAAARYNAFTWLTREDNKEQTLAQAVTYFGGEYSTMLRENVKEMEPVYRQGAAGPVQ